MTTRRRFVQGIMAAGALGLIDSSVVRRALASGKRSLNALQMRTASAEGSWSRMRVEGRVIKPCSG